MNITPLSLLGKPAAEAVTMLSNYHIAARHNQLYIYQNNHYVTDDRAISRAIIAQLTEAHWTSHTEKSMREAMLVTAPQLPTTPSIHLLHLRNGIYDIRTNMLYPHSPQVLLTQHIDITYDVTALCPVTDQFYADIFAPDILPTIYEIIGLLLFPDVSFQKAFMLKGNGANGKSTFIDQLTVFLGRDNISSETLQSINGTYGAYSLVDKLANLNAETPTIPITNNHKFKSIVVGDSITV